MELDRSAIERFWEKVDRGDPDECWEWQAYRDSDGYGNFNLNGYPEIASRVAMEIDGVDIGDGHVLHHCDNPPCVNPNHLYLGDESDNAVDALERGLREPPRGERHGESKLTEEQVVEIRERYENEDITYEELSGDYPVSRTQIGDIINRNKWTHV